MFFVHFMDVGLEGENEEGWFGRMIPGGGVEGIDIEIRVVEADGGYLVTVHEPAGDHAPLEIGQQILVMLREFAT